MTRRFLFLPLLLLVTTVPANAAVHASLDSPQIASGDSVHLTLVHDGQTTSQPDLSPLKRDFDILGNNTRQSLQIANGHATSFTQLDITLAPKRSGPLLIPAITWDTDKSPVLTLNVSAAGSANSNDAGAAASGARVFMETQVDPKSPYVQASAQVTVKIYVGVPIVRADLDFPDTNDALVRQIGQDSRNTVDRNGQTYQVVTRHYLIFPQRSGHIAIQGPILSGNILDRSRSPGFADPFADVFGNSPFAGMMGTTKPIRIHADPIVLDVQPRPANAAASYWLPARNVSLQAHWNPTSLQAHVGDPITLTLKLRAEGLTGAQLPDLPTLLKLPPGLKAYPDQPALKDEPQGSDLIGSREQSVALIADQPGQFTIPELHLTWWDTQTNQPREATLPSQTLAVLAAPGAGNPRQAPAQSPQTAAAMDNHEPQSSSTAGDHNGGPPAKDQPSGDMTWKWISLGLGLLWLATLGAWLGTRKRSVATTNTATVDNAASAAGRAQARSAFLAACRANDASSARRNLLLWANAEWRGPRFHGLNALAKVLANSEITAQLQALDRACYAQGSWDGQALANILTTLPLPKRPAATGTRELAPLYR